jgi:hypothetical protein
MKVYDGLLDFTVAIVDLESVSLALLSRRCVDNYHGGNTTETSKDIWLWVVWIGEPRQQLQRGQHYTRYTWPFAWCIDPSSNSSGFAKVSFFQSKSSFIGPDLGLPEVRGRCDCQRVGCEWKEPVASELLPLWLYRSSHEPIFRIRSQGER